MKKGDYGYLNAYRKKHLIATCIYLAIILGMVLFAKFLVHDITAALKDTASDPTQWQKAGSYLGIGLYMLAAVLSLPAAKHFVAFFMVFRYHTMDRQQAEQLEQVTKSLNGGITLYDVTLSSSEYISYVPFLFMYQNKLYCLVQVTSKYSVDDVKKYLNKIISGQLTVFAFQKEEDLLRRLKDIVAQKQPSDEKEEKRLQRLKDQILVYSV